MFLIFNYKQAVLSEDVEQPTGPGGLTQTDEKVHHSTLRSADSWRRELLGVRTGGQALYTEAPAWVWDWVCSSAETGSHRRSLISGEDSDSKGDRGYCWTRRWQWMQKRIGPRGNHSNAGRRSKGRMKTEPRKHLPSTPNHLTIFFLKLQEASTYRIYWKETWRNKCITKEVSLRSI